MNNKFSFSDFGLMGLILISIAVAFLVSGCSMISTTTKDSGISVCDAIPEGQTSVICELAEKKGTTPEDIAKILKATNLLLLSEDKYTAKQAKKFIKGVIEDVEKAQKESVTITYEDVLLYVNGKKEIVSPTVIAAYEILDPDTLSSGITITNPLSQYDIELILVHLEAELDLVKLFL